MSSVSRLIVPLAALAAFAVLPATGASHQRLGKSATQDHEVYRTARELKAQDEAELRQGLKYLKLIKGDPTTKTVALTFDDGPHLMWTHRLLAILKENKVKATFFVVGKMVDRYPTLVQEEIEDGHQVANHTYDHVNLTGLTPDEIEQEYRRCDDAVFRATRVHMRYCRPPGGQYDHDVILSTEKLGLTTVLWTDDPSDYARPDDTTLVNRLMSKIRNGSIVLLHDGIQQTLDILPEFIQTLKKKGYKFVTVDAMRQQIQTKLASVASHRTR